MWPRYYIFSHFISICHFCFWNVTFLLLHIQPQWAILLLPVPDNPNPSESAVYRKISIKLKTTNAALISIFVCKYILHRDFERELTVKGIFTAHFLTDCEQNSVEQDFKKFVSWCDIHHFNKAVHTDWQYIMKVMGSTKINTIFHFIFKLIYSTSTDKFPLTTVIASCVYMASLWQACSLQSYRNKVLKPFRVEDFTGMMQPEIMTLKQKWRILTCVYLKLTWLTWLDSSCSADQAALD